MDDLGSSGWEERYREAEERCRGLSMQIERFQQQAGRVRELLTSKLQDMESHISAWRGRAEQADEQVKELEDKLEIARNELRSARDQIDLLEQCCRDKDNTMVDLERRLLEESQQHGRVVNGFESKMAKIKDWVASKLQGVCAGVGLLVLYCNVIVMCLCVGVWCVCSWRAN
ncbi:pleckstrin homology domain-containing family H member 2-like [Corticium candelabrum]|uniref:pleckstrin homology domain-containing family H member 2-like n=1 Tax=Corticium candelabrum TaxID=121492 RepID=UPI002E260CFE|nr:pleckstrin homology domain-containing family H member 2-like [Corticium candelabrum]